MSIKKNWTLRLVHILDEIEKAKGFISGKTYTDFEHDPLLNHALARSIEIIGEAANYIPADIREQYNDIPWRDMIDMRNKLIHGYDDIDPDIVWATVIYEFPILADKILTLKSILKSDLLKE